ncbi:unnamed protein product [Closterium sp. Yama58-4]|nr:unnamed protein product [Closterium sp. Yama58-4]
MYALTVGTEGDCYLCVPPEPGIVAAALGASESALSGTAPAEALPTFTLDSVGVRGQGRERYFLLVVDDYSRYTTVFPLRNKGEVLDVLIPWIRAVRLQLRERFRTDLPVLRLHSDRCGEFSSNLLRDFCQGEGILQSFTLPASPQQNGIAERRIGLVMEFYHPTSRRVLPSQDVTFDESVPFYRLFPYRSAPLPPPPLFLAPGPPPVDPLPPQGPAPSGVSSVDPLPLAEPVEVTGDSGAARGGAAQGTASGGIEPERAEPRGAEPERAEPGSAEPKRAESGGAEPVRVEPEVTAPGGAASGGAEPGGTEPGGAVCAGSPPSSSLQRSSQREPLSPQQLREWFARRTRLRSRAAAAGGARAGGTGARGAGAGGTDAGGTGAGGAGAGGAGAGGAGAGGTGTGDPGAGGVRASGTGGAGAGGAGAGGAGAGGTGTGDAGAGGAGAGGTGAGAGGTGAGAGGAGAGGAGAGDPGAGVTGAVGTLQQRPFFLPPSQLSDLSPKSVLRQVLSLPSSTALPPDSPLPAPPRYAEQRASLTERHEPASRPASPVRTVRRARRVPRPRPPPVPGTHTMALQPESDLVRAASPTVTRLLATIVIDPSFESTAASALVAELVDFAAACRLDYAASLVAESESVCPPSVGGESMDAEMASWKSTGTYVDEVPPPGVIIVDVMWIFRVKRPPGSPLVFKARYVARPFSQRQGVDFFQTFSPTPKMTTLWVLLHVAAQRDYELHSLDFSTTFLQGSLHEEIWLCHPPDFTGSFPPGTQWSLRRPVYDTSLPRFYILVYVDDLVFATTDTEALALMKSELQKRHTCTDLGELRSYLGLQITRDRARRTITLTQSYMVQ